MRIERLALKGLLRFTETVSLDLRDLPPGLIAITGENGAGKTTILEAGMASLYRGFFSREGELYDYATGRDSYLEAEIAIDGRGVYRTRVNLDGVKRTTDAVLEAIQPDGTRAVLNDGKALTFDAAVRDLFPARALLLASAFAAQNKSGSFVTLDKKDRKSLFATLLGLERYQAMSDTASQAAAFLDQARARLSAARDELARDTTDALFTELDRIAQHLQATGGEAEVRQRELAAAIAQLETRLATMQDQVAAYVSAVQRAHTIETELATRRGERDSVDRQRAAAGRALAEELGRVAADRDREVTDCTTRRAGNEDILAKATEIRAAVAKVAAVEDHLPPLREEIHMRELALEGTRRALQAAEQALRDLDAPVRELERAQADGALLARVPCGGAGEFATCQFLTNAQVAKQRIPDLEATVATRDGAAQRVVDASAAVAADTTDLTDAKTALRMFEAERVEHQKTAKYADALAAAEARIAELQQKQAEAEQRAVDREADARSRHDTRLLELENQAFTLDETITRLAGELETARGDLAASSQGNAQAVRLQNELQYARVDRDLVIGSLARVESGRQELERRRLEVTEKRRRRDTITSRLDQLTTQALEWRLLAKAFSRDGLPVLEIDAAGPWLSAYTNELLQVCFGARFTVELITQRASADGKKMVDDFSIRVFDNERGGDPRDIADLSGGEQVIVSEALCNAIGLYVNARSPMPIRTCWRDETTGALDPENASRYLQMLRKVHELGGYHHVFFICHNADIAALADAQIVVAGGHASIQRPPFGQLEAA